jgi:large subunit ribosomal protein L28
LTITAPTGTSPAVAASRAACKARLIGAGSGQRIITPSALAVCARRRNLLDDSHVTRYARRFPSISCPIYEKRSTMSRICELTGKGRMTGHNVSHANNKTKRVFLPNLQNVTLMSEKLDRSFKFRVSTNGLRSVEHNGGLDNWLLKTNDEKLSARALKVKRELVKSQSEAA